MRGPICSPLVLALGVAALAGCESTALKSSASEQLQGVERQIAGQAAAARDHQDISKIATPHQRINLRKF